MYVAVVYIGEYGTQIRRGNMFPRRKESAPALQTYITCSKYRFLIHKYPREGGREVREESVI